MEGQKNPMNSKNVKHQQQISHQKTKSEGATPLGTNFIKTHYHGVKQKMQPIPLTLINQAPAAQIHNQVQTAGGSGQGTMYQIQQPSNQSPFLDYQKYLEDEKLVIQNSKAKSSMGYYSVGQQQHQQLINSNATSGSGGGIQRGLNQQSKSPDLNNISIKAAHYKSQKHHQSILSGSALGGGVGPVLGAGPMIGQQISQSALANYSNVQNLLQQHSNRAANTGQQNQASNAISSIPRPSSRKKGTNPAANLIYDQSLSSMYPALSNYNASSGGVQQQQNMYKNPTQAFSNSKTLHKGDDMHGSNSINHNHHNTIEGISKDQLNESSNYLSDDPLMKSNQQLQNMAAVANQSKQKAQIYNQQPQYQSLQDESYLDASVYEQFIQGPHNISQYTAPQGVGGSTHKMLDDMNSYSQYIQRPLSQNTNITAGGKNAGSKLGRQSPAQKNNTTRTVNSQMNSSQPKKSQRTASLMHNSLNNSGQKAQAAYDRRLLVGRTPSPNFLKRIAGLMNIGNDFILPQQNMFKGTNQTNLIVGAVQSKRSQSKQAFSSNPQSSLQPSLAQPIHQNFIHVGSNTIQNIDKSLKQKFLKQTTSVSNTAQQQNVAGSILALGNASRFKSGSLTTSANTAQNSPKSNHTIGTSSLQQRNQAKQAKTTTGKSSASTNQASAYHSNSEFYQLSEAIKKNQMAQVLSQINPQQKLKIINDIEEKKALALVKGIKDYPSTIQKQQAHLHHQAQLNAQQQYIQQQQFLHQPVKMIGEIMEEDPQPLSSQEFMDEDKQSFEHHNYFPQQITKQGSKVPLSMGKPAKGQHHKGSKSITPNNNIHMIDGGTGSNGNVSSNHNNSALGDVYSTQPRGIIPGSQPGSINHSDPNNSISQYLEQLQNMRQNQKSQLSHHPMAPLAPSVAMSPIVSKTANQFFKQQQQMQAQLNFNNMSQGKQVPAFGLIQSGGQPPLFQLQNNQPQINIKPLLQQPPKAPITHLHSKSVHEHDEPTILAQSGKYEGQSNRGNSVDPAGNKGQAKKKGSNLSGSGAIEPPKIAAPSVEMYNNNKVASIHNPSTSNANKPLEDAAISLQKRQQVINFVNQNNIAEKTPFEKELDMKAKEIKNQKKMLLSNVPSGQTTQEQLKLQKYKEDSISILKQLQESGNIVITADMKEQSLHSKKNSVDANVGKQQQKMIIDMGQVASQPLNDKNKKIVMVSKNANTPIIDPRSNINSPKQQQQQPPMKRHDNTRPSNTERDEDDDEEEEKDSNDGEDQIMITQEEEQQIKEVISDLNHKAFYGKVMKKQSQQYNSTLDPEAANLSPRSREIYTVKRMIQESFVRTMQPPVTTTDFYRIGKMLGRGAFGKVNLAMHKLVRKLVAIKSLNKECLTDEAQKQKLMKEVSLLLKLRHNHVVKIYETIETEKHIIIVMELCAGGDLLNYVRKRRRLKEPNAKVIFKQIIDGLCYIHSKFIAHRDIKLDNILLDGKGNVKIADFGVSKQCQKGQLRMTEQCGTPAYIAPEILKDKGYTFSVDIWSAGVVLFAMLYGTVPFKANNMEELHKLIVKGKYVLKDDISIEARNLLRGLLEVNPEKRLTIKQIYRHKWFADLDTGLQLFNDQERDMIRKEYTYNDPRRYNRNENEEPVDCFTEHHLESVYNSLKNATSKSIILAPFNSTQSQIMEEGKLRESVTQLLQDKMMVLKFARRCREIDRQYEFNNNGELDNGVYHKFINNTEEQDDSGDERAAQEDVDKDLLCIPMLMSTRGGNTDKEDPSTTTGLGSKKNKGGRSSIDNSFEEDSDNLKRLQERQALALKIRDGSQLQKELRNRSKLDVDPEMVQTFEEYQTRYSNRLDQDKINKLVQSGYPREYVTKALEENEPNYCTAGYYLLGMDQNYC